MADRERKDFVRVRPKAGLGAVNIVCGNFALQLEAGDEEEVTRAEWKELYEHRGCLELVPESPQISQVSRMEQKGRRTENEAAKAAPSAEVARDLAQNKE